MRTLTLDALKESAAKRVYIDTRYAEGSRVGLRKLSVGAVRALQKLAPKKGEEGDGLAFARALIYATLVDPEPSDEILDALEQDVEAYNDLIEKITTMNGMSAAAQEQAARDFRGGPGEPGSVPIGG